MLQYFKTAKWEQEWVDTAEELIHTEYQDKYENNDHISLDDEIVQVHILFCI